MRGVYKSVADFDKKCYERYKLNEDILMEHAAYEIALEIYKRFEKGSSINIIAGPGNNGGDGVALARILFGDYKVNLYMPLGAKSQMCKLQLERFLAIGGVLKSECQKADVIVDALFGSGLKRDLSADIIKLITKINRSKAFKIACDIPTGIDDEGNVRGAAFKADLCVTMGALKLALFSDEAKDYVGEIKIANLGVSYNKYIASTPYHVWEENDLRLPLRENQNSHKGTYGHLGVALGDKEGAGIIAALSALNFGCGLVSVVSKRDVVIPYEIMRAQDFENFSAVAFGMGLGEQDDVIQTLAAKNLPMVIDADMFYKEEIKEFLTKDKIVLTPHPKEFASLLKITGIGEYDTKEVQKHRFELAMKFSSKYPDVVLVLKGANKIIAYNQKLHIDPNGTQALAKGGSGDVLAGMIGSLLAQGWHPLKAAIQGSLAHSIAGRYEPNYALTPFKLIKRLDEIKRDF
ncbi:MAG: NAD(P)H-hydrate dehydratase [Epsilonproteobacteria bacterium]|nr:NAD(P)H-hydrate dehydratase [Campylobacterota bacterium]